MNVLALLDAPRLIPIFGIDENNNVWTMCTNPTQPVTHFLVCVNGVTRLLPNTLPTHPAFME